MKLEIFQQIFEK